MFTLTTAQQELYDATLRFARGLSYDVRAAEADKRFPASAWLECARFGLLGLPLSSEFGGSDLDVPSTLVAYEAFGRGCRDNGLAFSLAGQLFSCQLPIQLHATPAVRARYLPRVISGELIVAHASSEPDAGSDVGMVTTVARKVHGGYSLTGSKTYSTLAPISHLAVVLAKLENTRGTLTEFLVPRESYRVGPAFDKLGLRTSPMGEIHLEDAFVPDDHVLGAAGSGLMNFMTTMEWERLGIVASAVGAMHRQLDECIEHARTRVQFGVPIGAFQAVSHRIVEMKRRLDTSRLLVHAAAHKKQHHRRATLEVSLAKLHVTESQVANSLDAIRTFGAYGVMTESGIERELRDAVPGLIYSGTSDIQRNTIARLLGLPAAQQGVTPRGNND